MKAIALLALATACAAPYVAVVAIDHPDVETFIGAVQCDVKDPRRPVMRIDPGLTDEQKRWVYTHEEKHLQQVAAFGDCKGFADHYAADSVFRLQVEADAFCSVAVAQRRAKAKMDPDFEGIVWRLKNRYRSSWSIDAVLAALPCG